MKTSSRLGSAVVSASILLMLAGCSNANKPVKETFEAALSSSDETMDEDGSYYRPHTIKIPKGHEVSVTLRSEDFDTYLIAIPPDGTLQRENDDCDPDDPEKGSCLNFVAHVGGDWQIVANSYDGGEVGLYRMTVEAHKP